MSEADELLADVRTLRRRARADRHAYWLPLLFFGVALAASSPLYVLQVEELPPGAAEYSLYSVGPDPRLGTYWTVALLTGALVTVWWYRQRGSRTGIEGRVGPALVAATVFLIAYQLLSTVPGAPAALWPLWVGDFTALLVVAVGLVALAWQERSPGLAVTAGAFAVAAVVANTLDMASLAYRLGWDVPFRLEPTLNLVLPAAVLLAGGAVAAARTRRAR